MTISQTQLVDILYKKLSGVSKTDTSTAKSPANEANASPQLSPGTTVWQQDYYIPNVTVLPTSNSSVVTVYRDSTTSSVQAVALSETVANETWATNLTDWIPPQFGAGYQVKLYTGPSGSSTPQNFTNLPVGGSGNSDSWYFDYSAGIVNFADTNVPTAVAGNVVYVVGARYTGVKGINNFANLQIANISINGNTITGNTGVTFGGNITVGNVNATTIYGNIVGASANYSGNVTSGNVVSNFYGNINADVISPYRTPLTVFNSATAIGLPKGTTSDRPSTSATTAGYMRFNSDLGTVEFYTGVAWQPLTNSITDQQITPTGLTATYTLDQSATSAGIIVSINGTLQAPNIAYTVSGNQITFAETPLPTDIIDVRFIASSLTVASVDSTVVDTGNITVGTGNTIVDSFPTSVYRSATYSISSTNPYDSQFADVRIVQNNSVVVVTAHAILNTGSNTVTFTANITGGAVNLIAKGTTDANQLRVEKTYFIV
jgi:hypothetical protein